MTRVMSPSQPWRHFLLFQVVYHLIQLDGFLLLDGSNQLKVVVKGARGLHGDPAGKTDAYVKVSYGFTTKMTPYIEENDNPEWNHNFDFGKVVPGYKLEFDVFDKDVFFDDWLGRCVVPVSNNSTESCALVGGGTLHYGYSIL
ncbi:extended synaptotagmin-1-like [Erpetoichthys calabaricus]|uniref:extended synaptotagmin-1-like n=1 Tax=Erpetoichthys calabaricus TaxID=27687 RepID=UPI002234A65B|nr:extended synaptotagmin-1-like [Erpetoichthys calabaricus]